MTNIPEVAVARSRNSRTEDKFVMRLPDGLRDEIREMAAINHRSMNTEMIVRITGSLEFEQKYEEMRQLNSFLNEQIALLKAAANA